MITFNRRMTFSELIGFIGLIFLFALFSKFTLASSSLPSHQIWAPQRSVAHASGSTSRITGVAHAGVYLCAGRCAGAGDSWGTLSLVPTSSFFWLSRPCNLSTPRLPLPISRLRKSRGLGFSFVWVFVCTIQSKNKHAHAKIPTRRALLLRQNSELKAESGGGVWPGGLRWAGHGKFSGRHGTNVHSWILCSSSMPFCVQWRAFLSLLCFYVDNRCKYP